MSSYPYTGPCFTNRRNEIHAHTHMLTRLHPPGRHTHPLHTPLSLCLLKQAEAAEAGGRFRGSPPVREEERAVSLCGKGESRTDLSLGLPLQMHLPPSAPSWQNAALSLSLLLFFPLPFLSSCCTRLLLPICKSLSVTPSLCPSYRQHCLNANKEGEGGGVRQPIGRQWGVSIRPQICLSLSLTHTFVVCLY